MTASPSKRTDLFRALVGGGGGLVVLLPDGEGKGDEWRSEDQSQLDPLPLHGLARKNPLYMHLCLEPDINTKPRQLEI